ncbi:MAG TPA: hypothetical protein VEZ11_09055 [Thermoanaerobaculia bacterium]|nr:hypothetical protein [Thermoanaerobaculia bacterium]
MTDAARRIADWIAGGVLFAATSAVVLWQNARLTVLWDLSYILENASRIAGGDIPYRDFAMPYAPGTFLVQAAIIRLFGRSIAHHIAWAAVAGGAATVVTWYIIRRLLPDTIGARIIAFLLAAPLAILGIYCIVPHPFYDPDTCLVLLLMIAALLGAERRGLDRRWAFCAGLLGALLPFIKQNVGLIVLVVVAAGVTLLIAVEPDRARRRGLGMVLAGSAAGSLLGLAVVTFVFGFDNYVHWTIRFAAARRLPPLSTQFEIYDDPTLAWWLVCAIAGGVAMIWRGRGAKYIAPAGTAVAAAPLVWIWYSDFTTFDPVEPEINLLRLWPLALVLAAIIGVAAWRKERTLVTLLPIILIAAIHASFLSQSTWGSTYGIWPLLVVIAALALRGAASQRPVLAVVIAAVLAATLLRSGWRYVGENERLTYAKVMEGEAHRSSLPALRGMVMRGEWLPEFEQLVSWTNVHVPRSDGVLCLPGEDLFWFATGRQPRFPVVMFDRTVNPYSAEEIATLAQTRGIRWVIVKKRLQINGEPMADLSRTVALLQRRYTLTARLSNYDVWYCCAP